MCCPVTDSPSLLPLPLPLSVFVQRRVGVENRSQCALGLPVPLCHRTGGGSPRHGPTPHHEGAHTETPHYGGGAHGQVAPAPSSLLRSALSSAVSGPLQGSEVVLGGEDVAVATLLSRLPSLSIGPGL